MHCEYAGTDTAIIRNLIADDGAACSIHDKPDISFNATDFDIGFIGSQYFAGFVIMVIDKRFDADGSGFAVVSYVVDIEEVVLEKAEDVLEVIDYTKLSIEERASILQAPTDDYVAEYDAYCQRMGYTAEKMKSVRYKMDVYDEFIEEYQYRKKHCGMRGDSGIVNISEKRRETR